MGATDSAVGSLAALSVQIIDDVEPLDSQFGVSAPLTVPVVLHEMLFGHPQLNEDSAVLPLLTYAILDAAKVMGLVEMLETSGLEYACLFRGDAAEELRDVAPYLVRLEESSTFTRNLFTKGDAGWQMWNKEPGMYFRSRADLNELRRHFRRFTKVQDEGGKWYYLRFWEPRAAQQAFTAMSPAGVQRLFSIVADAYTIRVKPSILVRRFCCIADSQEALVS